MVSPGVLVAPKHGDAEVAVEARCCGRSETLWHDGLARWLSSTPLYVLPFLAPHDVLAQARRVPPSIPGRGLVRPRPYDWRWCCSSAAPRLTCDACIRVAA